MPTLFALLSLVSSWVPGAAAPPGGPAGHGLRADSTAHPAPAAHLAAARPSDGKSTYAMRVLRGGEREARPFGTMSVEQRTSGPATARVVRRVIVYASGSRGRVVDTTLSVAATLAPIAERTYKPSGVIRLDFAGRRVTGAMGPLDAPKPIDATLGTPAFNSTDLELVLRSLVLRAGLRDSLPLYDPEMGGYRWAALHVEGAVRVPTSAGPRRAWAVRVHDLQGEYLYRIDQATRALLASDVDLPKRGVRYFIRRNDVGPAFAPGRTAHHPSDSGARR
jgi:hypothetical protein